MGQFLRLAAYLAVIAIGAWIASSRGRRRRVAIAVLFAHIGLMHAAVLITQKESWPFGSYQALHGRASLDTTIWRIDYVGVDAQGREWILDPWVFDSVHQITLQLWNEYNMHQIPPEARHRVLAHMLEVIERSRVRVAEGKRLGPERWLGPFALPAWYRLPQHHDLSPEPFRALRLYHVEWTARERVEKRWLMTQWPKE